MPFSLDRTCLVVPDRVITRAVDETTVLLDIESGRSFTLDPVGTRVWALLTSLPSAQAVYDALLHEFRADPHQLRYDLEALIERLAANHLLEVTER